jgi:hypothetical protein
MARKRGRRSTRRDAAELQAEIQAAIVKWDALSPEEKMRAGSRDMHSTPDFRKRERSLDGPFAAWARFIIELHGPLTGAFANWATCGVPTDG